MTDTCDIANCRLPIADLKIGNRKSKIENNFTLIEMMLVLVILLFLASILMPALTRSRAQARRTNCLSNLKQLAISLKLYSDEQKYFPDTYFKGIGSEKYYWCALDTGSSIDFKKGLMGDYVNNYNIYRCPEFEAYANVTSMDSSMKSTCSYGINAEYIGGIPDPNSAPTENDILNSRPAKPEEIKSPDKTLTFMDSATAGGAGYTESYYFWSRYSYVTGAQHEARTHFRHFGMAAGVFCDGHAEDSLLPDAVDNKPLKIGWPDRNICGKQ